jgi:hypothetical protein
VSTAKRPRLTIIIYIQVVEGGVQDGILWHPCFHFLGIDILPSTETQNFCCYRNELRSLIIQVENSNLDNLYNKSGCHVVSEAFPISKNTAAVDILLLKIMVTLSISLIHYVML